MKKIIILSMIIVLTLTGCNKNNTQDVNQNYKPFEPSGKYVKDEKFKKYETMNEEIIEGLNGIAIEEEKPYSSLKTLDDNSIETEFGLNITDFINYVIKVPQYGIVDSTYCIIYKSESGKEERIEKRIGAYFKSKKSLMESDIQLENDEYKSPYKDDLEILNNMTTTEINGYKVYVSSKNNELVINTLKKLIKNV